MKSFGYFVLMLVFSLLSCSSQKRLQSEIPFKMGNATCQQWSGGRAESGTGTTLKIPISQFDTIEFREVFFRGYRTTLGIKGENEIKYLVANFSDEKDGSSEGKDKFDLEPTEAVVSYLEGGKLKYARVTGIKDKQPILYRGKSKN